MRAQRAPLLAFDQVSFGYSPRVKTVLRSLSLEIQPGTVTAILGPNGAGKTTLLHLALGWLVPQSGQVRLNGQPLRHYSRRELGQWMALVPQSERVPFDYSILEYVLLGRAPYLAPLDMPGAEDCRIGKQVIDALRQLAIELEGGALVTVDTERTRLRILPLLTNTEK